MMNGSPMKFKKKKKKKTFSFIPMKKLKKKKNYFHFFLATNWWSCQVQISKNNTRQTPTDVQNCTNQDGIGLGYKPKKKTIDKGNALVFHQWTMKEQVFQDQRTKPCPNLTQIRSSTTQMARESQQNAPIFFTGFLK